MLISDPDKIRSPNLARLFKGFNCKKKTDIIFFSYCKLLIKFIFKEKLRYKERIYQLKEWSGRRTVFLPDFINIEN